MSLNFIALVALFIFLILFFFFLPHLKNKFVKYQENRLKEFGDLIFGIQDWASAFSGETIELDHWNQYCIVSEWNRIKLLLMYRPGSELESSFYFLKLKTPVSHKFQLRKKSILPVFITSDKKAVNLSGFGDYDSNFQLYLDEKENVDVIPKIQSFLNILLKTDGVKEITGDEEGLIFQLERLPNANKAEDFLSLIQATLNSFSKAQD